MVCNGSSTSGEYERTQETIDKMSKAMTGRTHTQVTTNKISQARKMSAGKSRIIDKDGGSRRFSGAVPMKWHAIHCGSIIFHPTHRRLVVALLVVAPPRDSRSRKR